MIDTCHVQFPAMRDRCSAQPELAFPRMQGMKTLRSAKPGLLFNKANTAPSF
jgi:hypothetical protein